MSQDKERLEKAVLEMVSMVDGGPPDWNMVTRNGFRMSDAKKQVEDSQKKGHIFVDTLKPPGTGGSKIMSLRLTDEGLVCLDQLHNALSGTLG